MEQKGILEKGIIFSILLHVTLITIFSIKTWNKKEEEGFKYFVSLVQLPSGGGSGKTGHVRELGEFSKVEQEAKLTYPTREKQPRKRIYRKKERSVIVKKRAGAKSKSEESSGSQGPTISFSGESAGFGPGESLQIGNFPYPFYLITVKEKIGLNWNHLVGGKRLGREIWVYFKVARDGHIIEIELEKSCGVSRLDTYALKSIKDAEPFPMLPKNYDGEYLAIRVIFE